MENKKPIEAKLTIENLAPYLPYGLSLLRLNKLDECKKIHMNNGNLYYPIQNNKKCKPILRPIFDLINWTVIDGVKVMPLQQINKLRGVSLPVEEYDLFENDGEVLICKWGGVYSFWFEIQTSSFYDNRKYGLSPQLEMFQYLFKHHFDVFGLIDAGLAIDINTLTR